MTTLNDYKILGFEHAILGRPYNPPPCGPAMQSYSQGYDEAINRTENA